MVERRIPSLHSTSWHHMIPVSLRVLLPHIILWRMKWNFSFTTVSSCRSICMLSAPSLADMFCRWTGCGLDYSGSKPGGRICFCLTLQETGLWGPLSLLFSFPTGTGGLVAHWGVPTKEPKEVLSLTVHGGTDTEPIDVAVTCIRNVSSPATNGC